MTLKIQIQNSPDFLHFSNPPIQSTYRTMFIAVKSALIQVQGVGSPLTWVEWRRPWRAARADERMTGTGWRWSKSLLLLRVLPRSTAASWSARARPRPSSSSSRSIRACRVAGCGWIIFSDFPFNEDFASGLNEVVSTLPPSLSSAQCESESWCMRLSRSPDRSVLTPDAIVI